MSEEIVKEEKAVAEATKQAAAEPAAKKKKNWPIIAGVVVAVLVVAGFGFWTWHEQPSFCNAFCHTPMDGTVATFEQPANSEGVDKWGNTVSNTNAMLAVTHREAGANCLSCHVPTLSQQIHEVQLEITGDYYYPLEERGLKELVENSGGKTTVDGFCMKSGCHEFSRQDLTEMTKDMDFNPHRWQHGETECSECHKSHRASVFYCTQCHNEAKNSMPDGWVTYEEGKKIAAEATGA